MTDHIEQLNAYADEITRLDNEVDEKGERIKELEEKVYCLNTECDALYAEHKNSVKAHNIIKAEAVRELLERFEILGGASNGQIRNHIDQLEDE
jgi:uncharacterized coiled-coil DUF342 family protein